MANLKVNDKIILLKWGVFEIVTLDSDNKKCQIKYLPDEKDFKTPPKITWLTNDAKNLVDVCVEEYD